MNFIQYILEKSKKLTAKNKTKCERSVVFPESNDTRILEASLFIVENSLASFVILIGNENEISSKLSRLTKNSSFMSKIDIINPMNFPKFDFYISEFLALRKKKGMTVKEARNELLDPLAFSMMMVRLGDAHTCISGASSKTATVLTKAFQIIQTKQEVKLASSYMIVDTSNCSTKFGYEGILFFADCGVVINPDSFELAQIALSTAASFRNLFAVEPKVALLSFSTKGSASSKETLKVIEAIEFVKKLAPELQIDGELQLDAALVKSTADKKCSSSVIAGTANVLIFPTLDAGNIGCKLVREFGNAKVFGAFLQGLKHPIGDLSRGCSVEDIVVTTALMIASD